MIIIKGIVYFFWSILGLFFWIPLLFRVTAAFCGSLMYHMVINKPEVLENSKVSLDLALSFYAKGFRTISHVMDENGRHRPYAETPPFELGTFLGQLFWTIFFWGISIIPFFGNNARMYLQTFGYTAENYATEANRYLSIHDTTMAIKFLSEALEKDEFNANYYYARGILYVQTSQWEKAANDLISCIKTDSVTYGSDPKLIQQLVKILYDKLQNYEQALGYISLLIRYSPENLEAYLERAFCHYKLSEYIEAINDCDTALRLNSNKGNTYFMKGLILLDSERNAEACMAFQEAEKYGYKDASEYLAEYCSKQ